MCRILYWTLSMPRILPILGLALALRCGAYAQTPTPALTLTLQEAMERARANSQQLLSADIAEGIARAKVEIAARGLTAVVVQNFYGMAVAQRHFNNARRSLQEAQQFVDITQKQEAGGEAAHSDVVKAQLTLDQRQRDVQEGQLAYDKARIGFAVFLFPDFRQD